MKTKLLLATVFASTFSLGAFASDFSYNYADVSAGELQLDDSFNAKVVTGSGSVALNDNLYLVANVSRYKFDTSPFDLSQISQSIGLGVHGSVANSTDVFAIASALSTKTKVSFYDFNDSNSETGYALDVGIRHAIDDVFEVSASLSNVHQYDDFFTTYTVNGLAHITSNIDIVITAQKPEDSAAYSAGVRYSF